MRELVVSHFANGNTEAQRSLPPQGPIANIRAGAATFYCSAVSMVSYVSTNMKYV